MAAPRVVLVQREEQPQDVCCIDWSHPLARGLVFAAIPSGLAWWDCVSEQLASPCNGSTPSRARFAVDGNRASAVSLIGATSGDPALFADRTGLDGVAGVHSLFVEGSPENNATTTTLFQSAESGAGNGLRLDFDDVASVNNGLRYWANNGVRTTSASNALGTSAELATHRVMLTNDGTNSRYYTKRALNTTAATTVLPNASASRRTRIHGTYSAGSAVGNSASLILAWDRVLTLEEYQQLHDNPWQLFEPQRVFVPTPAAAGGSSGTSATTNANDTSSASGTTTVVGTSASTNANDAPSASGTTTVTGASAQTNADDTSAATGTTTLVGESASTNADDASSASGAVGNDVSGSSATTNANDTGAASGTTTVVGALARTNANDSPSASGTTTVLGASATTNANDAAAASGAAGAITGTSATTNQNDTATASGPGGPAAAPVGGGGWAWAAPRKKRHDYLSPPTREQMAERVRKQREALGILPKPAQKRIESAVKKEARRAAPDIAELAPVAAEVAQDSGVALQAVIDAIAATYANQRGLVAARMEADAAQRREQEAAAAEQARIDAEEAEQARQERLVHLRAADDELLRQGEAERKQAIDTIRKVQKALLALIA